MGVSDRVATNISYFPNPVNDQLTIAAGSLMESLAVYNFLGTAVMQVQLNGEELVIYMSSLSAGLMSYKYV